MCLRETEETDSKQVHWKSWVGEWLYFKLGLKLSWYHHVRRRRLHWYWYYASVFAVFFKGMLRVLEDAIAWYVPTAEMPWSSERSLNRFSDPGSRFVDYLLNGFFRKQLHRFCTGLLLHQHFQETLRPCHGRLRLSEAFFHSKDLKKKLTSTQWGSNFMALKWLTTWTPPNSWDDFYELDQTWCWSFFFANCLLFLCFFFDLDGICVLRTFPIDWRKGISSLVLYWKLMVRVEDYFAS